MLFSTMACVSHLKEAKTFYAQGQKLSRDYQTKASQASFQKALREAQKEVDKNPSGQAYMLKGLSELELEMWPEAEESFLEAFDLGFEKGEEWAQHLALFGLASSLEESGLLESSRQVYRHILDRSRIPAITLLAAQKYTESQLEEALNSEEQEKMKKLDSLLRTAQRLSEKDMSCGYYFYLQAQIYGFKSEYRMSFEKAVMARELGLPSEPVFRDNDNQIVFCYRQLREELQQEEWTSFSLIYQEWIRRWNWPDPATPAWKKR
jgi:tetratricopeptide (TPR) repeat protein